jgi:hypothetical protein
MKRSLLGAAVAAMLSVPATASAADSTEMREVRRMIEQMKADYEKKIESLEQRLEAAEQKAGTATESVETGKTPPTTATTQREPGSTAALTSGSAFNPQLSVILDGNYYHVAVLIVLACLAMVQERFPGRRHTHASEP